MSDPHSNIDGLPSNAVGYVLHYGKRSFTVDSAEGTEVLARIRSVLRDGSSDIVPVAHTKGLTWLAIGAGVPTAVDEVSPGKGESVRAARKRLGLR
jgi:hypothetical protein